MDPPTEALPITPLPEVEAWASTLGSIARRPLEECEAFPAIARRFEAWWSQEVLDRPLFIAQSNRTPERPITRRTDRLDRPADWLEAKRDDLARLHRVGDTLPAIRVDFGPALLGGLFGAEMRFDEHTSWTEAFIDDDWSNAPDWTFREDSPLWRRLVALLELVAEEARGRHLVMSPDLGGSADVLINLRGGTQLCMDVIDRPQVVRQAIDAMYPAWHQTFREIYRLVVGERSAGLVHWLNIWSDRPYLVPACDFNFMIGQRDFDELCLPDIARQTATVGRGVFHLDGPGAARHIDSLLEVEHLEAIQFTPGEGSPSIHPWIEMFRKIQKAGRSLFIITPAEEVLDLCDELRPEGLAIWVVNAPPPDDLDELYARFCRRYDARP